MSNRKNYNSIVFLTVYLGLVLVGASPQVLAQAALTSRLEIKNEIVVEDDLDKKPDEENSSAAETDQEFINQYAETVLALLKKNYLTEVGGYSVKINALHTAEDGDLTENLFPALRKDVLLASFTYSLDKEQLLGKLNLKSRSNADISHVGSSYLSSLNSLRLAPRNTPENLVLEHTKISFKDNQVFIVTRLPRAAIDDLLARKDAQ